MSRDANQETRSVGKGMTGPQLAKEFRKAIAAGRHPFEPWMTAAQGLGGDPRNNTQFNKVFNEMLRNLEKDSRVFGGKNGAMTFEKWFEKEVIGSKSFKDIRVGDRSFRSIFNSVLQPMGPRDGKPVAALETLVKSRNGLTTIENSKLAGLAKGMLGTFSGSSFNASRQRLAIMMSRAFLKRNAGGSIPGGAVERGRYGYGKPFFIGMPKTIKQVEEQRAKRVAMEKANEAVTNSRFAKTPVTQYGELLSPTSGRSFPVPGVGGLYMKGDEKVFVKPVLDERAAVAEIRATQIAREVHGLHAPTQKVVVMRDPTDPTGRRKLLALESKFDPKIAATDAKFTTDEYFRQLVASALRGDKDLARGNLSGNILSDVGPAGVFSAASGLRGYSAVMPSVKDQAYINLLGRKGSGAKKFFAESTHQIPKGMTADEYHSRMLKEIESALPKLKQTVSRFDLNSEEKVVYEAMIKRLSDARGVNWKELHGIHSGLQMSPEKQMTPAAIAKMVAADELKRRQTGHSASLSDNAFKTDANGFRFGGLLEAITKGKAMHKIGAGFGKDSTGGWGVTSLQIGMAEKLFGSTGLTKRTQKILYDKFAAALAQEMPYGYAKNAQGHLIKALEPSIMDTVIRSAASSTLSAPEGRKILSTIDREILRKKFANWESKKDTPLTETLKQLVFGIEKREMGGPVNSGQPYIVGEKGPELFVPRNAGGIIPNGYKSGGFINGYGRGGPIVELIKQLALIMGISKGSEFAGDKIGGTPGDMLKMVGQFLPFLIMGGSMSGIGGKGKSISTMFPKATTPIGAVGVNKVMGTPQLTKYGTMLSKLTGSSNLLSKALGFSLSMFTRFNIAVGAVSIGLKYAWDKWQAHKEALRLNALGYGMTAEAAQKAGLKFTNFNDKIKEAINNAKALKERNTLLYESMQGSGTPLDITIEEYKKLKKEVKTNYSDQVALINQTGNEDPEKQRELAIRLKEQLIAMGMSAEDAAKKIYTMYALSDQSANAAAYTVRSQGFNDIKDTASAAASAIDSLTTAMATNRDATEQANQLNTAMMALSTDVESRQAKALKEARKKAAKDGTYFSSGQEKQLMLDQEKAAIDEINSQVESQVYLTKEVVDEMAKIDPSIRQIVNEQETALSLWQKTRIQVKGYTGDLRALNAEQTNDLYNLQISLGKKVESANREGVLKKQYADLDRMLQLQAKYQKAARGQSVADQISDRDKIASLQKQIDANNKLADARLKALDAAKQEGDIGREIAKKQAEYDAALATGNIAGAQQASLDIQGYQSELQYNAQKKSIEDSNILKNVPLQKLIEAIQSKQQGISDNAQLAGEKLGDLSGKITKTESAISEVNTAMLNWQIELLKKPEAERQAWKTGEQSKKMLAAVADAAEKAGVKLNGLKDLDLGAAMVASLEGKLGALSTIDVNGNVIINIDGKRLNIGAGGDGTRANPYNLGNAGVGTSQLSDADVAGYGGIYDFGPWGISQKLKKFAQEKGLVPGEFFSVRDKDGKVSTYRIKEDGNISRTVNPYTKADGGHIRGAGTATSDSIPAYLSNGEYVIKADSVAKYGVDHFDALNAGKFAQGGLIKPIAQSDHKSSFGNGSTTVNVNHQGGKLMGPIEAWQDANKQIIKIEVPPITANFATNSYTLNKEQRLELQAIAKDLIKHKLASIVVEGHTDSVGKGKDNKILSQNRANAIAEYMSKFVPGTAFTPIGYGEYRPLVPNTTSENRAKNRRAELFLPDKYKTIYPEFIPEKHQTFLSRGRLEGGGSIEGNGMIGSTGKLIGTNGTIVSGGSMHSAINWGKLFKKIKSGLGFHKGGPVGHRHGRNLPKTKPSPSPSPTSKYMSVEEYRKQQGMDLGNTSSSENAGGTNWLKFLEPGEVSDPSKRSGWSNLVHSFSNTMTPVMKHMNPGGPMLYELFGKYLQQSATNIYAGEGKWNDYTSIGSNFAGGPIAKGVGLGLKGIPKALKTIKQIPTAIKVGQKLKAGNFDDLINIGKSTAGKSRPSIMQAADGSVHYMKIMQDVMEGAFEVTGSTIAKRFKMPSTDNILGSWKNLSVILSKDFASKGMKTLEDAGAMLPHGMLNMDWLKANASMKSFGKMRAVSSILGHGDMHPGNLLLKGKKALGAFDWGIIDNLTNPAETALKAGSTLVGKQASQFTKGFASVRKSIAKQGPEKFIDDILTKSGITDEGQLRVLRTILERNVKSLLDLKLPGKFHKGGAVGHRHGRNLPSTQSQNAAGTISTKWTKLDGKKHYVFDKLSGGFSLSVIDTKGMTLDSLNARYIDKGLYVENKSSNKNKSSNSTQSYNSAVGTGLFQGFSAPWLEFLGAKGVMQTANKIFQGGKNKAANAAFGSTPNNWDYLSAALLPLNFTASGEKAAITAAAKSPSLVSRLAKSGTKGVNYLGALGKKGISSAISKLGTFTAKSKFEKTYGKYVSSPLQEAKDIVKHAKTSTMAIRMTEQFALLASKGLKAEDIYHTLPDGKLWIHPNVERFLPPGFERNAVNNLWSSAGHTIHLPEKEILAYYEKELIEQSKKVRAAKTYLTAPSTYISRIAQMGKNATPFQQGLLSKINKVKGVIPGISGKIKSFFADKKLGMQFEKASSMGYGDPAKSDMMNIFGGDAFKSSGDTLFEHATRIIRTHDKHVASIEMQKKIIEIMRRARSSFQETIQSPEVLALAEQAGIAPNYIQNTLGSIGRYITPEGAISTDYIKDFAKELMQLKNAKTGAQQYLSSPLSFISRFKESRAAGKVAQAAGFNKFSSGPILNAVVGSKLIPRPLKNLFEVYAGRTRSGKDNLGIADNMLHPLEVPIDHARAYGPGTYFARTPKFSEQIFKGFGDNVYKMKLDAKALLKVIKSKGFIEEENIYKIIEDMGFDPKSLSGMPWDHPVVQKLMGEGYLGLKHKQAYTSWLTGLPGFNLRPTKQITSGIKNFNYQDLLESTLKGTSKAPLGQLANYVTQRVKEYTSPERKANGGIVGSGYNIPKFETGINNVPADMLAMLHKNEAVVPANMNPFNPNANNATMGGGVYNITNNINGYDGNLEQLSSMVTQKTITAIKSLDSRNAKMAGPSFTVGAK